MKLSDTRLIPRSKTTVTRETPPCRRPRAIAVALMGSLLIPLAGCVGINSFKELSRENQALEERVVELERSNSSLDSERVELTAQIDDLGTERQELDAEVSRLKRERAALERELSEHRDQLDARTYEMESLRSTYESLVGDLEDEVATGSIEIQRLKEGIEVSVADDILFRSGQAILNPSGTKVLERLATQIDKETGRVEVEGHTDDQPIRGGLARRFPTNWELAAARASVVVRLFEAAGVSGDRLFAISRGSYEPRVSNETVEGRAMNRRIEIRLFPPSPTPGEFEKDVGPLPSEDLDPSES